MVESQTPAIWHSDKNTMLEESASIHKEFIKPANVTRIIMMFKAMGCFI
jgi:hypothetical protein